MDRHAAYVALSRHRDGVDVHYGRDDFADRQQLVRTLSRERAKDMAADYAPDRAFADRREIRLPERELAPEQSAKARGMFAGFRPKPASPELDAGTPAGSTAPSEARAIERYARATADIERMRGQGLPVLAHQEKALGRAGDALDARRAHAAQDLATAFERNPALIDEASGGRTRSAARAMAEEARVRVDPELRADRFVEQWQGMARTRAALDRAGDRAGAEKMAGRMETVATGLKRDPQVESVLRRRAPELEIGRNRVVDQDLSRSIGRHHDRGMSR